jgi:beta-lactamase class A
MAWTHDACGEVCIRDGRVGPDHTAAQCIAILWPPRRSPIVLAVMSTRATPDAQPSNALIAHATRTVLPAL